HASCSLMQPVDRALGGVLGHALYAIVEGPTIMAVEIALPLGEEIRNDRMQMAWKYTRLQIRNGPSAHGLCYVRGAELSPAILGKVIFVAPLFHLGTALERKYLLRLQDQAMARI